MHPIPSTTKFNLPTFALSPSPHISIPSHDINATIHNALLHQQPNETSTIPKSPLILHSSTLSDSTHLQSSTIDCIVNIWPSATLIPNFSYLSLFFLFIPLLLPPPLTLYYSFTFNPQFFSSPPTASNSHTILPNESLTNS